MEILIVNGSPRREGNTARMCRAFAEGVAAVGRGISTETVRLYDLDYKGCRSCFACKRKGAATYGRCVVRDGLTPLLERAQRADALVIASPIYLMEVTGAVRSFAERLLFPLSTYEAGYRTVAPRRMPTVTIYTMNVTRDRIPAPQLDALEAFIGHVFTPPRRLCACDTYQFDRYDDYAVEVFSEEAKRRHREVCFPEELRAAFDAGRETAETLSAER